MRGCDGFGADENAARIGDQFMFGPAFLIAPVTAMYNKERMNSRENFKQEKTRSSFRSMTTGGEEQESLSPQAAAGMISGGEHYTEAGDSDPAAEGRHAMFIRAGSIVSWVRICIHN